MLKSRSFANGRVTSPPQPEDQAIFKRKLRGILIAAAILKAEKKRLEEEGRKRGGGGGGWRKEILHLKTPAREARRFGDPVRESWRLALFPG